MNLYFSNFRKQKLKCQKKEKNTGFSHPSKHKCPWGFPFPQYLRLIQLEVHSAQGPLWSLLSLLHFLPCSGFSESNISNSLLQTQVTSYFSVCFIISHSVPDCIQDCTEYGGEDVESHMMHRGLSAVCRNHFYYYGLPDFHSMSLCRERIITFPLSFWVLSWHPCNKRWINVRKTKRRVLIQTLHKYVGHSQDEWGTPKGAQNPELNTI